MISTLLTTLYLKAYYRDVFQPLTLITFGSTKNGETFAALWPQTPYPADQGMQKKDKTFTKGTDILKEPLSRTL